MDEQISQPQEQLPVQPPKHFMNKKFIITFVILMLLGTGAYAGIWYWQNQQVAQEVVPTFTPRADETAGWKTYTNTQYGFEFKYPSGMVARLVPNLSGTLPGYQAESQVSVDDNNGDGPWIYDVSILKNNNHESLQNIFSKVLSVWSPNQYRGYTQSDMLTSDTYIDSYPAKKLLINNYGDRGDTIIVLLKDSYVYIISGTTGYGFKETGLDLDSFVSTFKFTNPGPVACTQEAKQCLDGSYVSRTGPNCEFAVCPGDGTLTGHVTIGPNCPVEQVGNPCTPSPQAYTSRQVMVYQADGTTLVITQNFDTQGNYNIALPAGNYVVKSRTGISSTASVVGTITIKIGQTATLNFSIDTGIR